MNTLFFRTTLFGIVLLGIFIGYTLLEPISAAPYSQKAQVFTSPIVINSNHGGGLNTNAIQPGTCIKNPTIHVFMYHYVRDDMPNDPKVTRDLSVTPANFETHMAIVRRFADSGKISLPTGAEFMEAFKKGCFNNENIWLFTSDDGWKDTATDLVPIADKYKVPFILGIISGKVDTNGFISRNDLKEISSNPLMTIASHTVSHRALNTVSKEDEHKEICDSKVALEKMTGHPIEYFIYPTGRIGKNSVEYIKECNYFMAWSTNFGKDFSWNQNNLFEINRIRVSHDMGIEFFNKIIATNTHK